MEGVGKGEDRGNEGVRGCLPGESQTKVWAGLSPAIWLRHNILLKKKYREKWFVFWSVTARTVLLHFVQWKVSSKRYGTVQYSMNI